jgi:hypothetical protein
MYFCSTDDFAVKKTDITNFVAELAIAGHIITHSVGKGTNIRRLVM